ncbi:OLC1v1020649C1 [Oldenlandia corymbosa var. corymbosa]|uniref:OLC1v1020649C1 n=1 Tax=Oldenlandia corymbosa var. corymbosa TaxID=529605 RepID=A0AAV1EGW4_OLDCO|nr:OLC1v1020649C1 [Oldenlandia corymbosa var. corymbosa]
MGEFGRRNGRGGEDRFYSPPAMRRQQKAAQQNHGQLRLEQQSQMEKRVGSEDGAATPSSSSSNNMVDGLVPEQDNLTNLDRFIEHTTPRVPAQIMSKSCMRDHRKFDGEFHPYFVLGDLWDSFKEWSAYGAGVPLVLTGNESVVQYYVPYLSGIQLYIDPSKPPIGRRRPFEESDDSSGESSSDRCDEFGVDEGFDDNIIETLRLQDHSGSSTFSKNYPLRDFWSGDIEIQKPPGLLVFEYFAQDPPYGRQPLAGQDTGGSHTTESRCVFFDVPFSIDTIDKAKVNCLYSTVGKKKDFPHLHGSTSRVKIEDVGMHLRLALPVFGLSAYKFRISFWNFCGNQESQKANSLNQAAEDWLRQLQVIHPDFRFFQSHSVYLL